MHPVGHFVQSPAQKLGRYHALGLRMQFGKGDFAGSINGHKQLLLAFRGLDLGEVDVQVVDGIVLELLLRRAFPVAAQGQSTDAGSLKTAGQGRARAPRNRALERVQTAGERQNVYCRKATAIASCLTWSTVEAGVGPIAASVTVVRSRHLATVLGLMPWRVASICGVPDYVG